MKKALIGTFLFLAFTIWIFPQTSADQTLRRYLFAPQLLRKFQHELRLTEEQRTYIVQEINSATTEFTSMQWKLEEQIRELSNMVENRSSEESAIVTQLETVLDLEKEIKRKQLIMAVRIRKKLSDEQLKILRDLRARTGQEIRRRGNVRPNNPPKRDDIPKYR